MVKAVGGGYELGGGDNVGGMEISQTVGIVARSFKSSNQRRIYIKRNNFQIFPASLFEEVRILFWGVSVVD